jgi:hypothetical protein
MTTIREFADPILAGIVQSFLQDHGIDAVLLDEGASAWTGARFLVPVRLAVPSEHVGAAEALLDQFEKN